MGVAILGTGVLLGIVGHLFPFNRHSILHSQYAYSSFTFFTLIFLVVVFRALSARVQYWAGIVVLALFVLGLLRIVDLYDFAERRLSSMNRVMHSEGPLEHQRLLVNLNNARKMPANYIPETSEKLHELRRVSSPSRVISMTYLMRETRSKLHSWVFQRSLPIIFSASRCCSLIASTFAPLRR